MMDNNKRRETDVVEGPSKKKKPSGSAGKINSATLSKNSVFMQISSGECSLCKKKIYAGELQKHFEEECLPLQQVEMYLVIARAVPVSIIRNERYCS